MGKRLRNIVIVCGFWLIIISGAVYLYFQEATLPKNGSLTIPGLQSNVEILTDNQGYLHIYTNNNADLYKTIGYIHASKHLPKMDDFHRAANGTLSEVYGQSMVEVDLLSRTIGFASIAAEFMEQINPETRDILGAYCEGINSFIHENRFRLQRKFKWRRYAPAVWQPADCLAIQRLLAWTLSDQVIKKIVFYKLLEIYGNSKIMEGFPAVQNFPPDQLPRFNTNLFQSLNELVENNNKLLNFLKISGENLENSWVLAPGRLADNAAAMGGELPRFFCHYYEIIEMNNPDLNVGGLMIPGIPFIPFGHNSTIAWDLTIRPAGDLEFILNLLSEDRSQYKSNNRWTSFNSRYENIFTRGGDDVSTTVLSTVFGPVIGTVTGQDQQEYCLSILWNGFKFSNDLQSYTDLYKAQSWDNFKDAVQLHVVPAAEVDFLDIDGNIGTAQYISDLDLDRTIDRLPTISRFYEPGFIIPVHHLFRNFNPQSGSIRHHRLFPGFIYPDSTITRDVFSGDTTVSINDIIDSQVHPKDRLAGLLLPFFFEIVSRTDLASPLQQQAFDILKNWDYTNTCTDPAVTIFNVFLQRLCRRTYQDEMDLADPQLFHQVELLADESSINLLYLLQQGESDWFDDIRTTDRIEYRKTTVLQAFYDTVDFLAATYSRNISEWFPENTLPQNRLNMVNIVLQMAPQPTMIISTSIAQRIAPLSRDIHIGFQQNTFRSFNRSELIRNGAQILTVVPE